MADVRVKNQNGNGEQQQEQEQTQQKTPDLEKKRLQNQVRMLQTRLNQMSKYVQSMEQKNSQQQQQQQAQQKKEPFQEKPDFEDMDNEEVLNYIVNEVSKMVENKVEPVKQEVQNYKQETKQERMKRQIKETANKYNDFWDYAADIDEIAQDNPNIGPEEAYFIAKGRKEGITAQQAKRQSQEQKTDNGGETQEGQQGQSEQTNVNPRKEAAKMKSRSRQQPPVTEKPSTNSGSQQRGEGSYSRKEAIQEAMKQLDLGGSE